MTAPAGFPSNDTLHSLLGRDCPEAVVAADRDGVIRHWNAAAERMFGHTATTAVGQSLDLIIPERLRARHWTGWNDSMQAGSTRYADELLKVPAQHADGRPLSIEFRVQLLTADDGAVVGVAAFLRDVTETWLELRELRRKLAQRA